jgi:metal-sulfur cluster biosynthetic enzyme
MELTPESVRQKLEEVMDPELNMSVVDLGLVYNVLVDEQRNVNITMTLTTIGCPLFDTIENDIKEKMAELDVKPEQINIDLTFDPPWSMEMLSERAKAMLGI